jgi:hypothetical protein
MASINATQVGVYLVTYDEKENTVESYTGEDRDKYLAEDFKWDFGFTIPHMNALSDIIDTFVIGSIPPAIPDFKAVYPEPIDSIFMPQLLIRFIDVKQKKVNEGMVMLIHVMEAKANTAFIQEWVKERKDAEIRNKILGGTGAGQIAQPGQSMQITPDQLQKLIASGQVQAVPMNGIPQQPPKQSGIILK